MYWFWVFTYHCASLLLVTQYSPLSVTRARANSVSQARLHLTHARKYKQAIKALTIRWSNTFFAVGHCSMQFTWISSGKRAFSRESFFPCGKIPFSTWKKGFLQRQHFSIRPSQKKAFFPLDFLLNCSEIKYPSCK